MEIGILKKNMEIGKHNFKNEEIIFIKCFEKHFLSYVNFYC